MNVSTKNAKRREDTMSQLIDLSPSCATAMLAARGDVYAALLEEGESEFVAAQYALRRPAAAREGTVIGRDLIKVWWGGDVHPAQIVEMSK